MDHTKKLDYYLSKMDLGPKVYIDVGSSNETNLPLKFIKDSLKTIFIEFDSHKANHWKKENNFIVLNVKATPENIKNLLEANIGDTDITYLDIDIDGYDYFVLESILEHNRPYLFIAEINEKIPPPIKFTVKYDPNYWWDVSHFYGMSISQLGILINKFEYDILELHSNTLICVRRDKNVFNINLSIEEAYNFGYKNPRLEGKLPQFDYNSNVDFLLKLESQDLLEAIKSIFIQYHNKYLITL